jgi:integrase
MPVLTAAAVRKYAAHPSRRREIPDSKAPALYLVIQPNPSGAKSWALRFRRADGRPCKLTLGRVDLSDTETADEPTIGGALTLRQARELANQIDRQRARGVDVVEEQKARKRRRRAAAEERGANGFAAALREFFRDHKTSRWHERPRHWRDDARLLGLDYPAGCDPATTEPEVIRGSLTESWASRDVREIDSHDIHVAVDQARRFGIPGLPRRNGGVSESRGRKAHAALSGLFGWLLRQRKITMNPCVGVWRPSAPPARERVLSDREVVWLWRASDRLAPQFGAAVKLLLLSGARLNEIAGLQWGELSEDRSELRLPGERVKNHRPHTIVLSPLMREIVASVPRIDGCPFMLSTNGRSPISGWSKAKAALGAAMLQVAREEAAAAGRDPSKIIIPTFRLHDLRRSTASGLQRLGVRVEVIERCLNHLSGSFSGVTGIYQRDMLADEQAAAWARWSEHVAGLVSGEAAKVVPMRGKKGA